MSAPPPAVIHPAAETAARAVAWPGLHYGALGLPLAFVALPLYVTLPHHYATQFGLALGTLGTLLLVTRALDALADPWIGRWVDAWLAPRASGSAAGTRALRVAAAAAVLLGLGFAGLFHPPVPVREAGAAALLAWCAALLGLTYLSYSTLSVLHQAWGARLGGGDHQQARIVSWREGMALLGVLVASVLPSLAGLGVAAMVFGALLAVGWIALARGPRPRVPPTPESAATMARLQLPLRNPAFLRLLGLYLLNGVAGAVPATLVLFFIRDRLQLPALEPLFLVAYFGSGALSMPLWVRAVARWGLARAWLSGMAIAIAGFAGALALGPGDGVGFLAVCIASGAALGADLAVPGALLAGVIARAGHRGRFEGAYFGWWNFATKLNLALAAGLALPLLAWAGYMPQQPDAAGLQALALVYCALPCALKALAAGALYIGWVRPHAAPDEPASPVSTLDRMEPRT